MIDDVDVVERYRRTLQICKLSRSAHAALILFFLSDEMQRAHGDAAQAINAGYLRNFPSLGPNA